jgi:two-component system, NtrC family, sensor kinase
METLAIADNFSGFAPEPAVPAVGFSVEAERRNERLAGIGLLAAGIAHEINNPIGSALLAAETALAIKDVPGAGRELSACLENIVASTDRCGRIVRALLRYCRDEPPEKISCSINDVAKQAVDVIRPYAERKKAVIRLQCHPDVPLVSMNPLEIELVLVNLIRNALEAGGEGEVVVRTARTDGVVCASISDCGRGMSRRQMARVFDPLYTTRKLAGGCGLGLSIARDIVHRHQGNIKVSSQEGRGTVFTVDLPIAEGGSGR